MRILNSDPTRRGEKAANPLVHSAVADLNRALRFSPSSVAILVQRAIAYQLLNELDAAIADFTRVLELHTGPHADALYKARGKLLARAGRLREAEQDLERVEDDAEAAEILAVVRAGLRERAGRRQRDYRESNVCERGVRAPGRDYHAGAIAMIR